MSDLFKKLNVLIKASLNDLGHGESGTSRSSGRVGARLDGDVKTLRERINEAVQYEDEIKAQMRKLQDEAARWDAQADEAVARGDDANARYAIEQMKRAEQRAAMAEADLREHQRATQELIQRVNTLDAAVADAQRTEPEAPAENVRLPDLGNVLRETRDRINSLADTAAAQQEVKPRADEAAAVDDDLEQRRQRLSKR